MLNALTSYQFGVNPLRVVKIDGNPWFPATDVAVALGYRDAPNMVRMLDEDEKGTHNVSTPGGDQELLIISESGLYAVILKSRREEARLFRKWVTSEVLPAIRKTGTFTLAGADPVKSLTAALKAVGEARRLAGNAAGIEAWNSLGLPHITAAASDDLSADELMEPVAAYLATQSQATVGEVMAAIGTADDGQAMKARIGRLMRACGWEARVERVGAKVQKVFRPLVD